MMIFVMEILIQNCLIFLYHTSLFKYIFNDKYSKNSIIIALKILSWIWFNTGDDKIFISLIKEKKVRQPHQMKVFKDCVHLQLKIEHWADKTCKEYKL